MLDVMCAVLMGTLAADGQGAAMRSSPFVGRWAANVDESRLAPTFPFKSATLEISVAGPKVTIASSMIDPTGNEVKGIETIHADGTETPGTLTPGLVHVANWIGPNVLAFIGKKDGEVVALVTYQVSSDGRTLTARTSGMLEQVVVFERK